MLVLLTANADEVRIDAAVATLGVVDDQASAAVDGALEVVGVLALLLADQVLSAQQVLDRPVGRNRRRGPALRSRADPPRR